MNVSPARQGCPNSDDLSAVIDGVLPEELAVHVDSCPACRRQVQALRLIDAAIRRRLLPPEGLAERVRARVKESRAQAGPSPSAWWISPALRLAAALVVTAAALAVLIHVLERTAVPAVAVGPGGTPEAAPVGAVPASGGAGSPVRLVGGPSGRGVGGDGAAGAVSPSSLPGRVHHVWAVANVDDERDYLASILPEGSYEVSGQEDGTTLYTITLADRDLQTLVDRLYEHKWALVSHELPQPKRPGSVALRGRSVRYSLELVDVRPGANP
jgi:hypothetical protein